MARVATDAEGDAMLRPAADGMPRPPLKVFSDRAYLPDGVDHCLMPIPFWGSYVDHGGYVPFERQGREFLQLTELEDADVAVLPFDGGHLLGQNTPPDPRALELAAQFVRRASAAGLKTIVLVHSDSTERIRLPDILVFRTSINRRTRAANEFAMPIWHEDLVANYLGGQFIFREHVNVPSVGFCGHAAQSGPRLRRRFKMLVRRIVRPLGLHIDHNDGIYLRRAAMCALSRCASVQTHFIHRSQYFLEMAASPEAIARMRNEYIENLIGNDYTLCVRGYANNSLRFYETLSVGRIPILLDTECVLPYDFLHDYQNVCLIVPEDRLWDLGRLVREYHDRLTSDAFLELQVRIREFWVRWLSPEGFFRNLPLHCNRSQLDVAGAIPAPAGSAVDM